MFPKTLDVETFPYLKVFSFVYYISIQNFTRRPKGLAYKNYNYGTVSVFKLP